MAVAVLRWGCDWFFSPEPNSQNFVFLFLFVVCSSWLYRGTYNTLEDKIEFWWQIVRNLTTHFPSQHIVDWLTKEQEQVSTCDMLIDGLVQKIGWRSLLAFFCRVLAPAKSSYVHLKKNSLKCPFPGTDRILRRHSEKTYHSFQGGDSSQKALETVGQSWWQQQHCLLPQCHLFASCI